MDCYYLYTLHVCVNASNKNRALGILGQFHPPKVGICAKCVSENLQNSNFQIFQAFHRGIWFFIGFLSYSGHFTYPSVPKAPFLLDVFTCCNGCLTNIHFDLVP